MNITSSTPIINSRCFEIPRGLPRGSSCAPSMGAILEVEVLP